MPFLTLKFAFFSLFMALCLNVSPAFAKGSVNVGNVIPHNLNLEDQSGKTRSFSDIVGKKGVVLVFVRSAEWCPFCQKQLIELDESSKRFEELGYPVVSVSYDTKDALNKFVTKNKPNITMLSDPRSEAIRAFGILNEEVAKGTRSYGIPHPGVYIVGKDKKVQAKFFKDGFKNRPSAREILLKIEALNPNPKPKKPYVPVNNLEGLGQDPIIPGDDVIEVPSKIEDDILSPNGSTAPLVEPLEENLSSDNVKPEGEAFAIPKEEVLNKTDSIKEAVEKVEEAQSVILPEPAMDVPIKEVPANDGFDSSSDLPPPPSQSGL